MKLIFPGTKGEIEEESPEHRYHTSIEIRYKNTHLLVDLGVKHAPDIVGRLNNFDAIFITHAHPDHYIWTKKELNTGKTPVYLTEVTLDYGKNRPLLYKIIKEEQEIIIKDLSIEAFNVIHSIRCPAVCFRIEGDKNILYAPDILDTEKPKDIVFKNIDILVADGSSINVNMVRRKGDSLFGHAMIKTIINWCKKYSINKLIITHCGKQIVTGDNKHIKTKISDYSGGIVEWQIAYDGLEITI
jgi:ribonuclease BN (tRNA processing enzyme)